VQLERAASPLPTPGTGRYSGRMTRSQPRPQLPIAADAHRDRLQALFAKVAPQVPDIDPSVVLQVLEAWLRPIGNGSGRRFLLRDGPDGRRGP
jgi:hypothetical protein